MSTTSEPTDQPTTTFQDLRDALMARSEDYDGAVAAYRQPTFTHFNWATDWFDHLATQQNSRDKPALVIIDQHTDERTSLSYAQLSARSRQVAGWLASLGVSKGDRLLLMLGNQVELWEVMLAAIRLGVVTIPATTLLTSADLRDRIERGGAAHVVCGSSAAGAFNSVPGDYTRIAVGEPVDGWTPYDDSIGFAGECPRS